MDPIANFLFEARMLKALPRSGYQFLGNGRESVAEHVYITTMIGFVMAQLNPDVDSLRLMGMCLLHDLPEARTGDLNSVQKGYVTIREGEALADAVAALPFGPAIDLLLAEFNANETPEAQLAHDADQLAFILDLKALADVGYRTPQKWIAHVVRRLHTGTGQAMAEKILRTDWDAWWLKNYVDSPERT